MVVVFHLGYDLVVMIFPLVYVARDGFKTLTSIAITVSILLTWYIDKIAYIVDTHFHNSMSQYILFYRCANLIIYYSCMLIIFCKIWQSDLLRSRLSSKRTVILM
jgi:hypothetical protein